SASRAGAAKRGRQISAPLDPHVLKIEPRGQFAKLGGQSGRDLGAVQSRLEMRGADDQAPLRALRLEIDAGRDAVAKEKRQHVVTMRALLRRRVDLDAI